MNQMTVNQQTEKDKQQMEGEFIAAIERLTKEHGHLVAPITFTEAFCIVGALQLALRHPEFPRTSRSIVEAFIRGIQETVSKEPVLRQVIEMGFDPSCDRGQETGEVRIIERIDGCGDFFTTLRDGFERALRAGIEEMERQKRQGGGRYFNTFAEMTAENGQGFKVTIEFFPPTIPTIPSRN